VTVASAYFQRGDTGHAVRMCRKAIVKAEALDSSVARASAYWNASNFEAQRGSVANAVPLAERALALLSEGQDARNLARLRSALGHMQLNLNPPEVPEALKNLEQAAEELVWSSASTTEIASNNYSIARAHYLAGDFVRAEEMCAEIIASVAATSPLLAAEAEALVGQVAAAHGDVESAARGYRRAVFTLTSVGADKDAAQLWFELADLLEDVGEVEAARDAYRSAAAASGLRARPKVSTGVLQP
jgi:tetratricopeptide (TPR) repeat protein